MPPTTTIGVPSGTPAAHAAALRSQAPAENSSAGVTRSTPPMRNSATSSGGGFAVPMSIPRYTSIESAERIAAPISRASAAAIADFPDAVGPASR